MGRIQFTNIIIDEFSSAKREPDRVYIHILTHIHTDHTKGLSQGWNYAPIYCSTITKQLLLQKYEYLPTLKTLQLDTPTEIRMSESLSVTVTFFNANHCFGAVMVLVEGYMGRILYTGDIRFNRQIFQDYYYLYPKEQRNESFTKCAKKIDILYLDNTFLKRKFNFPSQQQVRSLALKFIQQLQKENKTKKLYVALDLYGKEEMIEYMAQDMGTKIVVTENKKQIMLAMERNLQLYTVNEQEGRLVIIQKSGLKQFVREHSDQICLILSGWVNNASYRYGNKVYCLPYSLHSNFKQIHDFVRSIGPHEIRPIVIKCPNNKRQWIDDQNSYKRSSYSSSDPDDNYIQQLQQLKLLYWGEPTNQYKAITSSCDLQKRLITELMPSRQTSLKMYIDEIRPIHHQFIPRDKYKLNNQRNQQQITRIKDQLSLRKKVDRGSKVQIVIDEENKQVEACQSINLVDREEQLIIDVHISQPSTLKKKKSMKEVDLFNDQLQNQLLLLKKTSQNCKEKKNKVNNLSVTQKQQKNKEKIKQKLMKLQMKQQKMAKKSSKKEEFDISDSVEEINIDQFSEKVAHKRQRQRSRQKQADMLNIGQVSGIKILKEMDEVRQFMDRNRRFLADISRMGLS